MPSQSSKIPKVNRSAPVDWSSPTRPINNPRPPATKPLVSDLPLMTAIKAMPRTAIRKNSGGAKARTRGRMIGTSSIKESAPNAPPIAELVTAAPIARPACPFFVIGNPSKTVAALTASPGVFRSIAVIEPPTSLTACAPSKSPNAAAGSMTKVNGMSTARLKVPDTPGKMPTTMPMRTPASK